MLNAYKSYVAGVIGYPEDSITISGPLFPKPVAVLEDRAGNTPSTTGTVTLATGAAGSVDGITVDGVAIMSGVENFDTSLPITATAVAANITAHTSIPNYNATASGAIITITNDGLVSGETVVSSATTITTTDVDMAGIGSGVEDVVPDSEIVINIAFTLGLDAISSGEKSTITSELIALLGPGVVRWLNDGSPVVYR